MAANKGESSSSSRRITVSEDPFENGESFQLNEDELIHAEAEAYLSTPRTGISTAEAAADEKGSIDITTENYSISKNITTMASASATSTTMTAAAAAAAEKSLPNRITKSSSRESLDDELDDDCDSFGNDWIKHEECEINRRKKNVTPQSVPGSKTVDRMKTPRDVEMMQNRRNNNDKLNAKRKNKQQQDIIEDKVANKRNYVPNNADSVSSNNNDTGKRKRSRVAIPTTNLTNNNNDDDLKNDEIDNYEMIRNKRKVRTSGGIGGGSSSSSSKREKDEYDCTSREKSNAPNSCFDENDEDYYCNDDNDEDLFEEENENNNTNNNEDTLEFKDNNSENRYAGNRVESTRDKSSYRPLKPPAFPTSPQASSSPSTSSVSKTVYISKLPPIATVSATVSSTKDVGVQTRAYEDEKKTQAADKKDDKPKVPIDVKQLWKIHAMTTIAEQRMRDLEYRGSNQKFKFSTDIKMSCWSLLRSISIRKIKACSKFESRPVQEELYHALYNLMNALNVASAFEDKHHDIPMYLRRKTSDEDEYPLDEKLETTVSSDDFVNFLDVVTHVDNNALNVLAIIYEKLFSESRNFFFKSSNFATINGFLDDESLQHVQDCIRVQKLDSREPDTMNISGSFLISLKTTNNEKVARYPILEDYSDTLRHVFSKYLNSSETLSAFKPFSVYVNISKRKDTVSLKILRNASREQELALLEAASIKFQEKVTNDGSVFRSFVVKCYVSLILTNSDN